MIDNKEYARQFRKNAVEDENGVIRVSTELWEELARIIENSEEAKHGEWLPDYETFVDEWERESEPVQTGWVCSLCGRQEFNREPYCHCGAKMDGGKEE